MSTQYTVVSAALKETKEIGGGNMNIYNLAVTDPTGQAINCELLQRPESPTPTQGQTIDGDMQPGKNANQLPTLKKAKQENGGGRGGGGYDSPVTIARITRSHSQEMALRFLALSGGVTIDWEADAATTKAQVKEQLDRLKRFTDWFDNDVAGAAASVEQAAPPAQAAPPPQQQPPPAQQPPAAQPAGEDDIPF